jgi:2'-5' RNA ligase
MTELGTRRCFIALPVDDVVAEDLRDLMEGVEIPNLRATPLHNLHLTLKFLGNVPDRDLQQVIEAVELAVEGVAPFELSATGLEYLPNARRARVFSLAMDLPAMLSRLAEQTEEAMAAIGLQREARAFHPHITLGRFRTPRRGKGKNKGKGGPPTEPPPIEPLPCPDTGCRIDRVVLMESELKPSGAAYTALAEFHLRGEE